MDGMKRRVARRTSRSRVAYLRFLLVNVLAWTLLLASVQVDGALRTSNRSPVDLRSRPIGSWLQRVESRGKETLWEGETEERRSPTGMADSQLLSHRSENWPLIRKSRSKPSRRIWLVIKFAERKFFLFENRKLRYLPLVGKERLEVSRPTNTTLFRLTCYGLRHPNRTKKCLWKAAQSINQQQLGNVERYIFEVPEVDLPWVAAHIHNWSLDFRQRHSSKSVFVNCESPTKWDEVKSRCHGDILTEYDASLEEFYSHHVDEKALFGGMTEAREQVFGQTSISGHSRNEGFTYPLSFQNKGVPVFVALPTWEPDLLGALTGKHVLHFRFGDFERRFFSKRKRKLRQKGVTSVTKFCPRKAAHSLFDFCQCNNSIGPKVWSNTNFVFISGNQKDIEGVICTGRSAHFWDGAKFSLRFIIDTNLDERPQGDLVVAPTKGDKPVPVRFALWDSYRPVSLGILYKLQPLWKRLRSRTASSEWVEGICKHQVTVSFPPSLWALYYETFDGNRDRIVFDGERADVRYNVGEDSFVDANSSQLLQRVDPNWKLVKFQPHFNKKMKKNQGAIRDLTIFVDTRLVQVDDARFQRFELYKTDDLLIRVDQFYVD